MIDILSLTRVLAVGGFLPLCVIVLMTIYQEAPSDWRSFFSGVIEGDPEVLRTAGGMLIFLGIVIGVGPDIFVILDHQERQFYIIDRTLDWFSAMILILGAVLRRSSKAAHTSMAMAIWFGVVAICVIGGVIIVAAQ